MLRTYFAQQRQFLHMDRKITLPNTDCGEGSPHSPISSGRSVSLGSTGHALHWHAVQAAPSRRTGPSCRKLLELWHAQLLHGAPRSISVLSGSSFSSWPWQLARQSCRQQWSLPAGLSHQRRQSSQRKMEWNVRVPTNLHGLDHSARPKSRWAPKTHRMMGKTQ